TNSDEHLLSVHPTPRALHSCPTRRSSDLRSDYQYLYSDDLGFHFMNLDDYSQVVLSPDDVGDAADYLLDGMTVTVASHQGTAIRSEEHTSELQSRENLVCRLLLEKKKIQR